MEELEENKEESNDLVDVQELKLTFYPKSEEYKA